MPTGPSETEKPGAGPNRRRVLQRGIVAAVGLAGAAGIAAAPAALAQPDLGLRGTWRAQLVRDNPPPGLTPTRFLFTFTTDGIVIASGPPVFVENGVLAYLASQQGMWHQPGPGQGVFSFITAAYSSEGLLSYEIESTIQMTMSGNAWSGTYERRDVQPDGTPIRTVTGTATAQIVLPP
jgi:hypothetical protein